MREGFMEKITFAEICKMMKKGNGETWEAIRGVFGAGLAFLPALLFPEAGLLANLSCGVDLLGARDAIRGAGDCVKKLFDRDAADFYSRYERAQAAQVLMVLTAYFDSIRLYLPDESGQIALSKREKITLTQASLDAYAAHLRERKMGTASQDAQWIADYPLDFRAPLESAERFQERLKGFYERLNEQFIRFFDGLSVWEGMNGQQRERFMAALRRLPEDAAGNYEKQYIALKQESEEFRFWAETREHIDLSKQIDVGFRQLSEYLRPFAGQFVGKGVETLDRYAKKYEAVLDEALIQVSDMGEALPDEAVFPKKGEIFIPQRFKALLYEKNLALEPKKTWDELEERDDIGGFILDTLRHSQTGNLPLLILGLPGAGKTLLCHMLAAKLLLTEYHVLIVRLRDAVADSSILRQVNDQIQRDFENGCTWDDIVKQDLGKQLLLIFDGYDELLQASGRTYADYLNKIEEFQKKNHIEYGVRVKCILTSRTTLIDKASIARGTTVIKLSDFDEERIKAWSDVWNKKNQSYFAEHGLEPFFIDPASKVYELAKQPLLLFLLALYDTDGNALKRNAELTGAELYDQLIRYYIGRELRKEKALKGLKDEEIKPSIDRELRKVSIAALGMYNRRVLFIRSATLQKDLDFFMEDGGAREEKTATLTKSEKLLGSFFFIHRSDARKDARDEEQKTATYEFLHNTFGEFLTAHFIVSELTKELRLISLMRQAGMDCSWDWKRRKGLLLALSYAPLSSRPIVVKMIREWAPSYFSDQGLDREAAGVLECFLTNETKRIVSGEAILALEKCLSENGNPLKKRELVAHLACFCLNLLILGALVCGEKFKFRVESETWDKLICLWRFGFSEAELLDFADIFYTERDERQSFLRYLPGKNSDSSPSALEEIAQIGWAIGDRRNVALAATLLGVGDTDEILTEIDRYGLGTSAQFLWNQTMGMLDAIDLEEKLHQLEDACFKQGRQEDILAYYHLLGSLLKNQNGGIHEAYYERALNTGLYYVHNITHNLSEYIEKMLKSRTSFSLHAYTRWVIHLQDALIAIAERLPMERVAWDKLALLCRYTHSTVQSCWTMNQMIKALKTGQRADLFDFINNNYLSIMQVIMREIIGINYRILPDIIEVSGCLEVSFSILQLNTKRRLNGEVLYDWFSVFPRVFHKKPFTMKQRALLIRCLYLMTSDNLLRRCVASILKLLSRECPITEIYFVSPDVAYEMCCLQETTGYFDHDTFLSGAKQLLADHEDDMPVKLYRKLKDMLETT